MINIESMDEVYFSDPRTYVFDFYTSLELNQAFIDTIRNSGGIIQKDY